ncbi:ABC transporter substrate-binding protein [Treponema sp.]|uniref:ABC transporter substrate-binding protein n=1 Tax=Treponema sp. TaxID=166 RepID=UPI00298EA3C2|nr:ABC transporter substrate-binding protein [Treponema sp.]MCR5613838.1 ABC transporter substrate-binding protein [Treponema sp.]
MARENSLHKTPEPQTSDSGRQAGVSRITAIIRAACFARSAILVSFLAACALCLTLTGCKKNGGAATTESAKSEKSIIMGFSQIGAESEWRTCNTQSIMQAAENAGIQVIYSNAEQKQENQIKAIRSFIVYQVDVIVFCPIVQDGWDNVLQEAKDAKIPVIIVDRKIRTKDNSLYAGYIGTDSYEEGRKAGRFLLNKYKGKSGPINIMELYGTVGSSVSEGRNKGFHEVIDADPRFSVVYTESGDFLRSRGKEIAENLCAASPVGTLRANGKKIDAIFSHNDQMTLGFLSILENHKVKTGKDITIITIDAEQAAIDQLVDGKINCIIECNPKMGTKVIEFVKTLAANRPIPAATYVPETVFSEDDDLSSISPRGY